MSVSLFLLLDCMLLRQGVCVCSTVCLSVCPDRIDVFQCAFCRSLIVNNVVNFVYGFLSLRVIVLLFVDWTQSVCRSLCSIVFSQSVYIRLCYSVRFLDGQSVCLSELCVILFVSSMCLLE